MPRPDVESSAIKYRLRAQLTSVWQWRRLRSDTLRLAGHALHVHLHAGVAPHTLPRMPQGHYPHPDCTAWHITIGTARTRLHGGPRKTVDRRFNKPGEPFVMRDPQREAWELQTANGEPVFLDERHRSFIEGVLPAICARGRWTYHVCAAPAPPENDHFHILLDAPKAIHGEDIRKWLKRWLTEAMNAEFGAAPDGGGSGEWWVDGGSTKPVKDAEYFMNVFTYDRDQRTTPFVMMECEK